jgi:chemotaxis protein MotA
LKFFIDITTFVGLFLGIGLICLSIFVADGDSMHVFINGPSFMVVLGGSLAAVMVSFPLKRLLGTFSVIKKVFVNRQDNIPQLIRQIVSFSETARRDGLLALEERIEEIENPFLLLGVQMSVDGTQPEIIENVMRTKMDAIEGRHYNGRLVIDQLGRFSPAFGMIGTLIGLIIMLGNLQQPETIGTGMALALLTTLYGTVMANLICLPFSEKLGHLGRHELLAMEIVVRGILGIQSGDNPRVIEQYLSTFIPNGRQEKIKESSDAKAA